MSRRLGNGTGSLHQNDHEKFTIPTVSIDLGKLDAELVSVAVFFPNTRSTSFLSQTQRTVPFSRAVFRCILFGGFFPHSTASYRILTFLICTPDSTLSKSLVASSFQTFHNLRASKSAAQRILFSSKNLCRQT